ncbi:hypothetical protein BY458DRAFT_510244 [Sporodiniella umbellata]|nr:hypothetical protein BY458DRAFT_510244 [Sporodiniella umbellata]
MALASCIYEGHLYWRTKDKQWKWGLFRLDKSQLYSTDVCVWIEEITTLSLLSQAKKAPSCFLIRTVNGARHVLRAKRSQDVACWLFVLSRWVQENQRLLSDEKYNGIEAWRASLTEQSQADPASQHMSLVLPKDDPLTGITQRPSQLSRIVPLLEQSSGLKKRRSDDVRHWMGQPLGEKGEEEEMSLAELMKQLQMRATIKKNNKKQK